MTISEIELHQICEIPRLQGRWKVTAIFDNSVRVESCVDHEARDVPKNEPVEL